MKSNLSNLKCYLITFLLLHFDYTFDSDESSRRVGHIVYSVIHTSCLDTSPNTLFVIEF